MEPIAYTCPSCGVSATSAAAPAPISCPCGTLIHTLGAGRPVPVDSATFPEWVLNAPLPTLVEFWAPWCGHCRTLATALERIAPEYAGRLRVATLNCDDNQPLATQFQVQALPTLILFVNGRLHNQYVGALPIQQLRNWINRAMNWL